jgi:hypothetical protein
MILAAAGVFGAGVCSCTRPIGTVFDEEVDACVAEMEICNGSDDDCDGQIDEGGVCDCTDPENLEAGEMRTVDGPGGAADPTVVWSTDRYGAVWTGGFALLDSQGAIVESRAGPTFMGSESADIVYSAGRQEYVFCWSSGNDVICGIEHPGSPETETVLAVEREPDGYSYNNPRLAYRAASDEIGIVYQSGGYGAASFSLVRFGSDWSGGEEVTEASEHSATNIWDAALCATDEGYGFVYAGTDETLYLARFDEDGRRLGPDTAVTQMYGVEYLSKTLLFDGEAFTTAWSDFRDVHLVRFDKNGNPLTQRQITFNEGDVLTYSPVLAQGPWLGMVWQDLTEGDLEDGVRRVRFAALDTNGDVLKEIVLSEQGIYPWVASDGQGYLVSWREGETWEPDIAFVHIGCTQN